MQFYTDEPQNNLFQVVDTNKERDECGRMQSECLMNELMPVFLTFQGQTGPPGFPGNDGSPVSEVLFLHILSTHQNNTHTTHSKNKNPLYVSNTLKGLHQLFKPCIVQCVVEILLAHCSVFQKEFRIYAW